MKTNPIINEMKEIDKKEKSVYKVKQGMRTNDLSNIPSNNVVKVIFESYETLYDNVHHTNAFVNKIKKGNQIDEILEIWVNTTKVYWKKDTPTPSIPKDDLPF